MLHYCIVNIALVVCYIDKGHINVMLHYCIVNMLHQWFVTWRVHPGKVVFLSYFPVALLFCYCVALLSCFITVL